MIIYIFEMSGNSGFYTYSKNLVQFLSYKDKNLLIIFHTAKKDQLPLGDNVYIINNLSAISKKTLFFPLRLIYVLYVLVSNHIKRLKLLKKYRPDIVSIQQVIPIFDQHVFRKISKKYFLSITVHDVIPPQKSLLWSLKSLRRTYNHANNLIVHSESNREIARKLLKLKSENIKIIPHGVEISNVKISKIDARKHLGLDDCFTLLFFGAIRESKGLNILLNALVGLNVQIVIAGKLHENSFAHYDECIKINNINAKKFIKYIPDEDVPYFFTSSDYLCLPYLDFNSQSGVLMQAITYNIPVIASDVPTFQNFISENGIGVTFINGNSSDLTRIINELMQSNDKDFKKNISDCREKFKWENVSDRYMELFIQK